MQRRKGLRGAIGVDERHGKLAARGHGLQPRDGHAVVLPHLVVVGLVLEGQGEHALLLEVRLVNAREALCQHHAHVEEARFHGGVLSRTALTIVVLSHDDAWHALLLIVARHCRHLFILAVYLVFHAVALAVESVDGTHEQVGGYVLQVATETQPWPRHGYMVGGAFALGLYEHGHAGELLAVPSRERREPLQALGMRVNDHLGLVVVVRRHEEALLLQLLHVADLLAVAHDEARGREGLAPWLVERHLVAVGVLQLVGGGIEVEPSCHGKGHDHLWRANESVGIGVAVGTAAEVAVKRRHDGVLAVVVVGVAFPLADARAAGVGHYHSAHLSQVVEYAVALSRGANHLRTRVDDKLGAHGYALGQGLTRHRRGASQVLIR